MLVIVAALVVLIAPIRARAADATVVDRVLPDGVRILAERERDSQLVAIDVFVMTAGAPEDAVKPGLANFVARALLSGTANADSDSIAGQIGSLGGNVAATWDRNFTQLRSLTLASRFRDAAFLISDVLQNASFGQTGVEQARKDLLQASQDSSNDVYQQAYDQMRIKLYAGQMVPPTDIGDENVIRSLRPDDLRLFYDRYYTPDNIVISIVGNVDPDQAIQVFGDDLADFYRSAPQRRRTVLPQSITPMDAPVTVKSYRGDIGSGYILVGYLVPGAGMPEYPRLLLLNALLGGMKTSLLFTNLREKEGLCYETASSYAEDVGITDLTGYMLTPGDKPTPGSVPASAKPVSADSTDTAPTGPSFSGVRDALIDQFKLIRGQPPTDQMLARAKNFVIGSYLIRHERLLDRAYWLGFSEIALKPEGGYLFDTHFADQIDAVTPAQIQQVAQKYLSDGYVISMVLPGDPTAGDVVK
jgi:predicted Zn-dependent peptidase